MPSSSRAQHRFMEAIEHDPAFRRRSGVPKDVAEDFDAADAHSHGWKKREHAKKAVDSGMSPDIYKALYGDC